MPKKVWLVIEKNSYGDNNNSFSVIKNADTIEKAMTFKVYLEKLSDRENQSYFIATDVETATNEVIKFHNQKVANDK